MVQLKIRPDFGSMMFKNQPHIVFLAAKLANEKLNRYITCKLSDKKNEIISHKRVRIYIFHTL